MLRFGSALVFLAFAVGAAVADDRTSDFDQNSIRNAGMISAASVNCSTLSLTTAADAYLDALYARARANDELLAQFAEGSGKFHEMRQRERAGTACFAVLAAFPSVFNVKLNGNVVSGEAFVATLKNPPKLSPTD